MAYTPCYKTDKIMEKYEYKMFERLAVKDSDDLIEKLNKEGADGWRVVTAFNAYENDVFEYWEILFVRKCE